VLVTGGSSGLGAAFSTALLEYGAARVYASSRHPESSTARQVTALAMDVADAGQVDRVARDLPDVSIVINCAGAYHGGVSVLEAPVADLRADLEVNLFGVLNVCRALAPTLAAHKNSAFLNVHSLLSWMTAGDGYSVSKAAAWGLTNAVRGLVRANGTQVLALHVGFMETPMVQHITGVLKSDPLDVARTALQALQDDETEAFGDRMSWASKEALAGDPAKLFFGG
jgi:NAD(P)-dependent dehydrogenase (short-subunit alcohol dehydrogenase family)